MAMPPPAARSRPCAYRQQRTMRLASICVGFCSMGLAICEPEPALSPSDRSAPPPGPGQVHARGEVGRAAAKRSHLGQPRPHTSAVGHTSAARRIVVTATPPELRSPAAQVALGLARLAGEPVWEPAAATGALNTTAAPAPTSAASVTPHNLPPHNAVPASLVDTPSPLNTQLNTGTVNSKASGMVGRDCGWLCRLLGGMVASERELLQVVLSDWSKAAIRLADD